MPGGFPPHTYNPRQSLKLEERLGEVRDNLCKLVTVTGQTKSGKTVLARRILSPEESVWIDGGSVGDEDEFWQLINQQLELFEVAETEEGTESVTSMGGKVSGGANLIVAKGKGEASASLEKGRSSGLRKQRTVSPRVAAIDGLKRLKPALIIDDFHYLSKSLQGDLVRALKPLVFDGLPVVAIAIPHRRYDAMKVEREMTGRISAIEIPAWSAEELRFIPEKGFGLLNYGVDAKVIERLSDEAIGSPHLMQDFCRSLCKVLRIQYAPNRRDLACEASSLDEVMRDVAETIGRPIFEKLARGPRSRTERIERELKDGRKVDIYELVLHALAAIRPGLVTLEYEDLRAAIREVAASQAPQLHEVVRVLKHMATIASSDQSSTPVIDFEEDEQKLHITDPFFAFYLRWGQLG